MSYAYKYDSNLTPEENASNSMKMDRWRSRNSPTIESARKKVLAQQDPITELVRRNGHSINLSLWH